MGLLETTVHLNPVVILLRQTATEILGKIDRSTSFSVFDCDQLVKIGHHCCTERLKISKLSWQRQEEIIKVAFSIHFASSPPPPPPPPLLSHSSRKALYVGNKLTTRRNSWFYGLPLSIFLGFDTPNVINCIVLTLVINHTERNLWAAYN